MHELSSPKTWFLFLEYIIVVSFWCYFCKAEVDDLSSNPALYFTNPMSIMQFISLSLCLYCMVSYASIVLSHFFLNFTLPFSPVPMDRYIEYTKLSDLSMQFSSFMTNISINTCLIFIRCISLTTGLVPQTGIVFNTIDQVRNRVFAFCFMFMIMLFAFSMAAFFLFGPMAAPFSELAKSFINMIKMIMTEANLEVLQRSSNFYVGTGFFMVFHIFFLIVQQIMLAILIHGYQKERRRINNLADSERLYIYI